MPRGKKVIWTNEMIQDLIEKYNSGITIENLEKIFHTRKVSKILKENGITIKVGGARPNSGLNYKYTFDENYFENIDTKDKAYFLGFIYADGCVINRRDKNRGQNLISISQVETEPLEKFKKYIKCNKPLIKSTSINKIGSTTISYRIDIISDKIFKDLNNYGVVENKSLILIFPKNIKENLIPHFIRGYFDGDGSVYFQNNEKQNKLECQFCGTNEFLTSLETYFPFFTTSNVYKERRTDTNCWYLKLQSNKLSLLLYHYMYKDCEDLYLTRKREKFENFIKNIIEKGSTTIITNPNNNEYLKYCYLED